MLTQTCKIISAFARLRVFGPAAVALFLAVIIFSYQLKGAESALQDPGTVEQCGTWWGGSGPLGPGAAPAQIPRPPDGTYKQGTEHFLVHYEDLLLNGYVQNILQGAESSYRVILDTLGYELPPLDGANGGDSRTDIYIISASGVPYWGRAIWEDLKPKPQYPGAATSYIELIDTIPDSYIPTVLAHEYFHVVQLGYDYGEDMSFLEMISVWVEDRAFDDINRYLVHLPIFFVTPQKPLMNWRYSNVLWAVYMSENFGDGIIKDIMHKCALVSGPSSLSATDATLGPFGTTFSQEFASFTLWNYFTGPRDRGVHYSEGSTFPSMWIEKDTECLPLSGYATQHNPGPLASNYLTFLGNQSTDSLKLELLLEPSAEWIISITRFEPGGIYTENHYYPETVGWPPHTVLVADWRDCDSILVITNVVDTSGVGFNYSITAYHSRTAPPALPYVLVLDRDNCIRPFDGTDDEFASVNGEEYPFGTALSAKSVNYIVSDSVPNDLSLCGAVFIVGGFDGNGPNLAPDELEALMNFMDGGGDLYLESTRLGKWIDPSQGNPDPIESSFWSYFGCTFQPGDSMTTGNVSAWQTPNSSPIGAFSFDYDHQSPADNYNGSLAPDPGTDTLLIDQAGSVRGVIAHGQNQSERVHVTIMLGASMGNDGVSTREDFIRKILDLFDTIVPALSVSFMEVLVSKREVLMSGEIEAYSGETLRMLRTAVQAPRESREIPVELSGSGHRIKIAVRDDPGPGVYRYRLLADVGPIERTLWEERVSITRLVPSMALVSLSPNPSNGTFRLTLLADGPARPCISIFDPAGRLVYHRRENISDGTNTLVWEGVDDQGNRLPSGVYFLSINSEGQSISRKLLLIR